MVIPSDVRPATILEGVKYPDEHRLRWYIEKEVLTKETLTEAFSCSFRQNADRLALVGPDGHITYRQLDENATRLAAALLQYGVCPLDRAVFQCGNSNELLTAFFACLKASIIPICSLRAFREHEISYLGNLAGATLHVVQGDDPKFDDVGFAERMRTKVPSFKYILQARGERRGDAFSLRWLIDNMSLQQASKVLEDIKLDPFQVVAFQLSGGTTGVPKIIPRFQNEYLYNMRAVASYNKYSKEDVLFFPTPFMHNLNMGCYFGPFLLTGATVTVCTDISAQTLQALVRKYRPTWFGVAGPILNRVMPELVRSTKEEKARRNFIVPNDAPNLRRATGSPVWQIFGMTEGVIMFTRDGDPPEVLGESVGRPVSPYDEIKIVQPGTVDEVRDGEIGEALFRGPYTIRGYYKSAKEDTQRFTNDGFYRSGDLMMSKVVRGHRYYFFRGRIKDVINRGGEKINAEEVEAVVARHPDVLSCAVIGVPDPVYGEKACACVIPRSDESAISLLELSCHLDKFGLAKFKWPEKIELIKEFPTSAAGKLSKKLLREEMLQRIDKDFEKSRKFN